VNGPEPIISSICLSAGVSATRLGMMKGTRGWACSSASSTTPKGCLKVMLKAVGAIGNDAVQASYIFWPSAVALGPSARARR
jgi:hypothetical protein